MPWDCNADGALQISDATCVLGALFLGEPRRLPCGEGGLEEVGNRPLIDGAAGGTIDISDGIAILRFLFIDGAPHPLAVPGGELTGCVRLAGCSSASCE